MNATGNPFRPGSGLFPPYFAGRESQTDIFMRKVEQMISGTSMHMSLIGDWASGKTSLLSRFHEVADRRGCLVCEMLSPVSDSPKVFVKTFCANISDDLKRRGLIGPVKRIKKELEKIGGVGISALGFGASVIKSETEDISAQVELRFTLRTIWDYISSRYEGIVILIDDLDMTSEKQTSIRQVMITLRNGLMDAIKDGVRVICVICGAHFFENIISAHGPLVRFFEPIEIGELSPGESQRAILTPLMNGDITFSEGVVDRIVDLSGGQPYYIQEFSYIIYNNAVRGRFDLDMFDPVFPKILHDLARKIWRQRYVTLGDTSLKVLFVMAEGHYSSDDIIARGKELFELNENQVRISLTRLQRSGDIQKEHRGRYSVKDKLFGEYIRLSL